MINKLTEEELQESIDLEKTIREIEMEIGDAFRLLRTWEKDSNAIMQASNVVRKRNSKLKYIAEEME